MLAWVRLLKVHCTLLLDHILTVTQASQEDVKNPWWDASMIRLHPSADESKSKEKEREKKWHRNWSIKSLNEWLIIRWLLLLLFLLFFLFIFYHLLTSVVNLRQCEIRRNGNAMKTSNANSEANGVVFVGSCLVWVDVNSVDGGSSNTRRRSISCP